MNKSLLDTDILSEILKRKNPLVSSRATDYRRQFGLYTISSITVMEVVRGYLSAGKQDLLTEFRKRLSRTEVLPFTATTADLAGQIDADLQRAGIPIGRADPMIAAIAIEHNLMLATGNTKHFERIHTLGYPLQLDNWRASPS